MSMTDDEILSDFTKKIDLEDSDDDDLDFTKMKKKKKNPKNEEKSPQNEEKSPEEGIEDDKKPIDYSYEFLCDRLYEQLYRDRPELRRAKVAKIALPPPQLERLGGKKTIWLNFQKTCDVLNRDIEHVKLFFLHELCTQGSLNGQKCLIIRGRYRQDAVINLLTKYINGFVKCKICDKPNTKLIREQRLTRLQCLDCQSIRTVETVRTRR